jgi:hypothetical protein
MRFALILVVAIAVVFVLTGVLLRLISFLFWVGLLILVIALIALAIRSLLRGNSSSARQSREK